MAKQCTRMDANMVGGFEDGGGDLTTENTEYTEGRG